MEIYDVDVKIPFAYKNVIYGYDMLYGSLDQDPIQYFETFDDFKVEEQCSEDEETYVGGIIEKDFKDLIRRYDTYLVDDRDCNGGMIESIAQKLYDDGYGEYTVKNCRTTGLEIADEEHLVWSLKVTSDAPIDILENAIIEACEEEVKYGWGKEMEDVIYEKTCDEEDDYDIELSLILGTTQYWITYSYIVFDDPEITDSIKVDITPMEQLTDF